jgi:hypothetical protein
MRTIYGFYIREKREGRGWKKGKERKRKEEKSKRHPIENPDIHHSIQCLPPSDYVKVIKFMRSLLHQLADRKIAQRGKSNAMSPTDDHLLPVNGRDDLALLVSVANRWWQSSGE